MARSAGSTRLADAGTSHPPHRAAPTWRYAVLLAITAAAVLGAARIDPVVDFVDTVPAHDGLAPYRAVLDGLDGTRFVALYMPSTGADLRSDEGFDALVQHQGDLQAHLADRHEITHFLSAHEAMRGTHHLFWVVATSDNPPPDSHSVPNEPTYSLLRDRARDASGDVLAADGSSALVLAFLPPDTPGALREQAAAIAADAAAWHTGQERPVTGAPQGSGLLVVSHDTDLRTASDLAFWGIVSAAAVGVTLVAVLGSVRRAAVAVTSLAVALAWTYGIIGWMGIQVSFLTVFLAPVVAGIGIDHAIHLLRGHRAALALGDPAPMRTALQQLGTPMAVATLSTAGVLLLLGTVRAPMFAQVGQVAALGVALGFVSALVVVPLLADRRPERPRKDRLGPALGRLAAATARNRSAAVVVVVVLVGLAALAAGQLRIESGSAENEFPQDDPHIVLQHRIEEEYGAFQRAYLVFQGDIAHPRVLHALDRAGEQAQALPLYRKHSSVNDLLRGQAATDEGALDVLGAGTSGHPRTPQEARYAIHRLMEDPFWGTLAPFVVSKDLDLTIVAIQVDPWSTQGEMLALRDALVRLAHDVQELAGPGVTVHAAGAPVNRAAVVDHVVPDILWVAGGGTLLVFSVLALAWTPRRGLAGLRAAAVGAAVIACAAVILLGAVHVLDTYYQATGAGHSAALSHMFLLAFALTVGLGVDDHVHIVHAAWRNPEAPVVTAWRGTGRSVTGTTLTTLAAFLPLTGSYFLQSKNLAILVCLGVATAWLLTLLMSGLALASPLGASPEAGGRTKAPA